MAIGGLKHALPVDLNVTGGQRSLVKDRYTSYGEQRREVVHLVCPVPRTQHHFNLDLTTAVTLHRPVSEQDFQAPYGRKRKAWCSWTYPVCVRSIQVPPGSKKAGEKAGTAEGVEVTLDPEELDLDTAAMQAKYDETLREQQSQLEKEDLSDMVAAHTAKQRVSVRSEPPRSFCVCALALCDYFYT